MSVTLNPSDFQCLQDQLVDLKTKNYELTEKCRRGQKDFEAAKAKICSLQLKLEEQERDFQVTSTTLRREIEAVHVTQQEAADTSKEENELYKNKYKVVLHKAKEIQQRYEDVYAENCRLRDELEMKNVLLEDKDAAKQECIALKSQNDALQQERDKFEQQAKDISNRFDQQVEEKKIQDKKGLQMVKELRRQLALEKSKNETLQKRLETVLSSNGSSGSWNLVPASVGYSNLSICSIELSDERDTTKNTSTSAATTGDTKSESDKSNSNKSISSSPNIDDQQLLGEPQGQSKPAMPLDEQAALIERLTQLQQEKWILEEKLCYLEQANVELSEELSNKSDIIRNYFTNQALKSQSSQQKLKQPEELPPFLVATGASRRISFPTNINQLLSDGSSLKKVVDFVKERSHQITSPESDAVTREATKKMQLMLEETLVKCLKLQENLDFVTGELNKQKT